MFPPFQRVGFGLLILPLLVLCGIAGAKVPRWNQKMQELSKTFSDLLPELAESKPITEASRRNLEKNAKKLVDLVHVINMGPGTKGNPLPPEADPTIGFVSHLFEREAKNAYRALQSGHVAYAKNLLRSMSGYCITCHTRNDRGPDFPTFKLDPKTSSLSDIEKAELLTATRQFDAALSEFEKIIADKNVAKTRPFEWGRAVRNALTVSIRVKHDPAKATEVLDKVLSIPNPPDFYADNIAAWKQFIAQWKKEKDRAITDEEGLFMEAARLSKEARDTQKFALDHSADILYLRSTAIVHELLSKYPYGKRSSEALLMAGSAYELLEDRPVSRLPNLYYESCIRNTPHTEIAEKCYQRFEQNIIFGFTGSAGTFLPDDMKDLMGELRALAKRGETKQ